MRENLDIFLEDVSNLVRIQNTVMDEILQNKYSVEMMGEEFYVSVNSNNHSIWSTRLISEFMPKRASVTPIEDFTYIDVTAIDKNIGKIAEFKIVDSKNAPSRARKAVIAGDVIYSCVRPYLLNIAVINEEISPPPIASTAFAVLNGKNEILPKYLWLILRSSHFNKLVSLKMRGQAYPAINDTDLREIPIVFPDLETQRLIVDFWEHLNREVCAVSDLTTSIGEQNLRFTKTLAHSIENSYSIDGAIERKNLLKLFISNFDFFLESDESTDLLTRLIKRLSTIGAFSPQDKLNKGINTLSDCGSWANGSGFPKSQQGLKVGEIPFIKVSDMNLAGNEKYMTSSNNYISLETARDLNIKVHPSGTVIFPKIGGAIATNKRRILTSASAIDNNCLGLTPGDNLSTEYLYLILSSIDFSLYQVGTSVPALQIQKIGLIPAWIPNLETQNLIVTLADRLLLELRELQTKNQLVDVMKDSVISSWISSMSKMKERVA